MHLVENYSSILDREIVENACRLHSKESEYEAVKKYCENYVNRITPGFIEGCNKMDDCFGIDYESRESATLHWVKELKTIKSVLKC